MLDLTKIFSIGKSPYEEMNAKEMKMVIPSFIAAFLLFVAIFGAIFYFSKKYDTDLRATAGVLDLRGTDFSKVDSVPLKGKWDFYWEEFVPIETITKQLPEVNHRYIDELKKWNNVVLEDGTKLTGDGYATIHLKVIVDNPDQEYAFQSLFIMTAYKVYIDEDLVYESGKIGKTKETMVPDMDIKVVRFRPKNKEFHITFHISNFYHYTGGIRSFFKLGLSDKIQRTYNVASMIDIFTFGAGLIAALYIFGLFLLDRKNFPALYLSILTVLISLKSIVSLQVMVTQIFPSATFENYMNVLYYHSFPSLVIVALYSHALFPGEIKIWIRNLLIVVGTCLSLTIVFFPVKVYSHFAVPYLFTILTVQLYYLFIILLCVKRKREGSIYFLAGFYLLLIASTSDSLYVSGILDVMYVLHIGVIIYIFIQFIILSDRARQNAIRVEVQNAELKQLDKLKDDFLANTSHELRTPINGIVGLSESLVDGAAGPITAEQSTNLRMIIRSGRRLANLVNEILDFSKMKSKELQLRTQPVDIRMISNLVVALTVPQLGSKNVKIVCQMDDELPLVDADEKRVEQILINIVGNAVKFTHEGVVTILAYEDNGLIRVGVSDTGIGIPKGKHAKIFESFEQADGSTSREYGGTGIGLSVTKQLVNLHGSELHIDSEVGKGSEFYFFLPISETQEVQYSKEDSYGVSKVVDDPKFTHADDVETLSEITVKVDSKGTILIIDDEEVNIQVLRNQLSLAGYKVLSALDGFKGLELIDSEKIDLVLLDLMMPRMSGYEVCETARKTLDETTLPIIMLTAKNQVSDLVEGFKTRANDYLTKPFHKDELLARVQTHIKFKRAVESQKEAERLGIELRTAKALQEMLLPKSDPEIDDLEIASFYQSASETGGDWYFYQHYPELNKLVILIADVTGHGAPAAIITANINAFFRNPILSENDFSPDEFLHYLNDMIYDSVGGAYYMSFGFCVIDLSKGEYKFTYLTGAHCPCIAWRNGGFVKQLKTRQITQNPKMFQPKGSFVGHSSEKVKYKHLDLSLEHGDVLVLYTDGLVENMNPEKEEYSSRRLKDVVVALCEQGLSANELRDGIIKDAQDFYAGELHEDDITLIVLKIK